MEKEKLDLLKELLSDYYSINMVGLKFGEWTVIKKAPRPNKDKSKRAYWYAECSCGRIKIVLGTHLRTNDSKTCASCACRKRMAERLKRFYILVKISDEERVIELRKLEDKNG